MATELEREGAGSQWRAKLVNVSSTGVVVGVHGLGLAAPLVGGSWGLAGLAIASYSLQTLGVTAGYHRYFSHRAFKTGRVAQFVLAWLGCAAMQNGPLWWASHHRRHHRAPDTPGDPHSPVLGGFWHAHIGWVLSGANDRPDLTNVRDFARYAELRFLDRFKWVPTLATGAVSALAFGWPGVVWGLGVATTLAFHAPLFMNSAGHLWGAKRFETKDGSRNNAVLAAFVFGEGWHNNHHHDPSAAAHGYAWWEIDVTYWAIWALSKIGVVWAVRSRRVGEVLGSHPITESPRGQSHPRRVTRPRLARTALGATGPLPHRPGRPRRRRS
jgi:stearoyl-CoA desaturase (delta-9 desaturase)